MVSAFGVEHGEVSKAFTNRQKKGAAAAGALGAAGVLGAVALGRGKGAAKVAQAATRPKPGLVLRPKPGPGRPMPGPRSAPNLPKPGLLPTPATSSRYSTGPVSARTGHQGVGRSTNRSYQGRRRRA